MKKYLILPLILCLLVITWAFTSQQKNKAPKYVAGDLIFISNPTVTPNNLQLLTKTNYTYIGLVLPDKGKLAVYFAGDKVKKTGIAEFIALSKTGKFEHLRLRDTTVLKFTGVPRLLEEASKLMGMPNDKYLLWTDMEMYSSEFVWKVFKRAFDVQLGNTKNLGSFDLSSPALLKSLKEKYGENLPTEQRVISPVDIHDCELLMKLN